MKINCKLSNDDLKQIVANFLTEKTGTRIEKHEVRFDVVNLSKTEFKPRYDVTVELEVYRGND